MNTTKLDEMRRPYSIGSYIFFAGFMFIYIYFFKSFQLKVIQGILIALDSGKYHDAAPYLFQGVCIIALLVVATAGAISCVRLVVRLGNYFLIKWLFNTNFKLVESALVETSSLQNTLPDQAARVYDAGYEAYAKFYPPIEKPSQAIQGESNTLL